MVAYRGKVYSDPDRTVNKLPDPDPTVKEKPDPDPTIVKPPDPYLQPWIILNHST